MFCEIKFYILVIESFLIIFFFCEKIENIDLLLNLPKNDNYADREL